MRFIFAALAALAISACSTPPVNRAVTAPPLPTTAFVDVDQYLGKWYEIARFPNSFEEGCVAVTAEYARREDGLISVINRCRQETFDGEEKVARGRARIVDAQSNAKLKVSFFGPFWGITGLWTSPRTIPTRSLVSPRAGIYGCSRAPRRSATR